MCWTGETGPPGPPGYHGYIVSPCCGTNAQCSIPNESLMVYNCVKCHKKYFFKDLITLEEYKCRNRTELIDKMLNER